MDNDYSKKLIKKIKAKKNEYDTLNSMLNHYSVPVGKAIGEILTTNNIDHDDAYSYDKVEEIKDNCSIIVEYNELFTVLYKKLSLKAHPDKLIDNVDNKDFVGIRAAYDNKDIVTLIEYSHKYNLSEEELKDVGVHLLILILEKQLFVMKNKIKVLKSQWTYGYLIDDSKFKEAIDCCKRIHNLKLETKKLNDELEERKKKIKELQEDH